MVPMGRSGTPQTSGLVSALQRAASSMVGELRREAAMGAVGLGHDHEAGGVLVETVNDARPRHAADAGKARAAMGDEGVHQRAGVMAAGGMDDETRPACR